MKKRQVNDMNVVSRLETAGGYLSAERMRQSAIAEFRGNWVVALGKIAEAGVSVQPHWAGSNLFLWKQVLRAEFLQALKRAKKAGWEDVENRVEDWLKAF